MKKILAVLFCVATLFAQEPEKKSFPLTPEQGARLELAFLKVKSANQELTLMQLEFQRKQKELEILQQAWSKIFDEVCKVVGVETEGTEINNDFKTLTGKPLPAKEPEESEIQP